MADNGALLELITEQKICYANPFMLAFWQKLKEMNKKLIIISDMYIPASVSHPFWKIPCSLIGIIAGTNTIHNAEPDASEAFLQNGKLVSYLYSQQHNRDLLKKACSRQEL